MRGAPIALVDFSLELFPFRLLVSVDRITTETSSPKGNHSSEKPTNAIGTPRTGLLLISCRNQSG